MKLRKVIAIAAAALIAFTGIRITSVIGKAEQVTQSEKLTFSAYTAAENQLWRFLPADDNVEPTYYLQNIDTLQYLMVIDGELTAAIKNDSKTPVAFSVSGDKNGYSISYDDKYLNTDNGTALLGDETALEMLAFYSGEVTELKPAGTYSIRIKGSNSVLTDNSDAYYSLSRNADVYSSATTQKWHVDTAKIINGEQYYTFVSLDSNRYLSSDGENAILSYSRSDNGSLWKVNEISYKDFPTTCNMKNLYNHYYRLTNALGQILYVDGSTGDIKLTSSISIGPSSVFVFDEGNEFANSGTFHIANIGGKGGANDTYDETCRRFLQSVKDGYELSVSLQPANKQANQKWEITYVCSEDREGNWYRFHYYTIKNVEFDLYLTIENDSLVLSERDEANDYQLWNLFNMDWGWIKTQTGGDGVFLNQYSIANKGANCALICSSSKITLRTLSSKRFLASGNAGYSWRLNGEKLELGHGVGNNDPSKLVQSVEVTLLCYASGGLYLEADGPDIPVEGSIKELYISNDGDDSNSGESADKPIKTVERALELIEEKTIAKRGKILFRRGDTFVGNLELTKIAGRTGKYIYFEDYGDPDKSNPIICSDKDAPAAVLNECYCVSIRNIDFAAPNSKTSVVEINNGLNMVYQNSSVSGDKNTTENGIVFSSSGDKSDSDHESLKIDNISVLGCKTGILFEETGGMYFTDSEVGQMSGSGLVFTGCKNIELNSVRVYDTSENNEGAIRITSSGLILGDLTVERTAKGNGIEFIGDDSVSSSIRLSNSAIVNIAGVGINVTACDKQVVNGVPVAATDSFVIDNILFSGNTSYDVNYINTRDDSANLASYIGNSTFVRKDKNFYEGYPNDILGVIQNNNTFISPDEYAKMRSDYKEFVKSALAKKKGTTSDMAWETFQNSLVDAIAVYNSDYVTKFTIDNTVSSVEAAMAALTYDTGSSSDTKPESSTEEIVITIEEAVTEMLKTLAASDEDTISLRVSEDFVLTVDMQKIVTESAKKLKITFTDENEEMLYQWSFEVLPCLYDIVLKVDSEPVSDISGLTNGQIISVRHEGELPAGTKLIVKNTVFTERTNLMLKYYSAADNALLEVGTGIGERTVLMSNDNSFLQLTISSGGDFAVEKDTVVSNNGEEVSEPTEEKSNLPLIFMIIGCAVLVLAGAVVVLILIKNKRRGKNAV